MVLGFKKILQFLKSPNQAQAGFSLMEIVVVLAVFSTMTLLVTDVFLTISRVQVQTSSAQKVQSDARFAIEAMAREIKYGTIDYQCYANHDSGTGCYELRIAGEIDLNGPVPILVTRDQQNDQVFYGFWNNKIKACSNTRVDPGRCYLSEPYEPYDNWQDVTPTDVVVDNLAFYISPASSPFSKKVYCLSDDDCDLLNTCNVGEETCDTPDIQPRVTIIMSAKSTEQGARGEEIILQTSASTMRYLR